MKISEKISIVTGVISIVGLIATGFLGELYSSVLALSLVVLSGFYFLYSKYNRLSEDLRASTRKNKLDNFPYTPKYQYLEDKPIRINKKEKRVVSQSDFLNWEDFSIVFWVKIEDAFLNSPNNKYLFSYYTEREADYNYRNAFYLGIKKTGLTKDEKEWRLILGGENYDNQSGIYFPSSQSLVGWRHFVLSWNKAARSFRIYINGGNILERSISPEADFFPSSSEEEWIYFGGWKNWKGGLSGLEFYDIRIFQDAMNQGVSKELFELEKPFMKKF